MDKPSSCGVIVGVSINYTKEEGFFLLFCEKSGLKDNYGDRLCFHGGVDIQEVMPRGSTSDVENEVKRRIAIWAPDGGYILCAAHCIQDDVSPENVVALYKAEEKWGNYPLDNELLELRKSVPKK
jgi:uroporphyrinogen-III decarboxylase